MPRLLIIIALWLATPGGNSVAAPEHSPDSQTLRIAALNAAMGLESAGELQRRLQSKNDPNLLKLTEVLQRVRPDVVLLSEMDYQEGLDTAALLNAHYLSIARPGLQAIEYPYHYAAPVNTGLDSGLDLDGNGQLGDPGDAWGYGRFPGQYGMLLLSRIAIDNNSVRSFQTFHWSAMPGAMEPRASGGGAFYPEDVWSQLRLSSKSHWDAPIQFDGVRIHLLASHPTPPTFDGPEDRNGRRNHDEIRLWADYILDDQAQYLVDDSGQRGGLGSDDHFVILGDLNADPHDGDSSASAMDQLLRHPQVNTDCTPGSAGGRVASSAQGGANLLHKGDAAHDTADFDDRHAGNLRIDYALPSRSLTVLDCGVFWPIADTPGAEAASFSDHRLVWVDVQLPEQHQAR